MEEIFIAVLAAGMLSTTLAETNWCQIWQANTNSALAKEDRK